MERKEKKPSENDQLTGHFQIFFFIFRAFFCFFSPVKLVKFVLTVLLSKIYRQSLKFFKKFNGTNKI